jgi:hypothetical protein
MRFALIALATGMTAPLASAQIAFETYGSGWPPVAQHDYYHISGLPGSQHPDRLGFRFTSQATGPIDQITVAAFRTAQSTGTFGLEFYADAGGTPGTLLGATGYMAQLWNPPSPGPGTMVIISNPSIHLQQGSDYYLIFRADAGADAVWHTLPDPASTPPALMVSQFSGGSWQTAQEPYGAFRVRVVPAPGAAVAVGGLLALSAWRRSRGEPAAA